VTFLLAYAFTGNWCLSAGIGGADAVFKILLYFAHEKAWTTIGWGYLNNKGEKNGKR
jgi:uncharacterized membrane protein